MLKTMAQKLGPALCSYLNLQPAMVRLKNKRPLRFVEEAFELNPGGDLRSHTVARAVSSAQRGLTTVFGMGTGVTLAI